MFYFEVLNGNIQNQESYIDHYTKLKDGKYVVKEYKKTRSNDQNKYLRSGVYKTIADSMGEDKDYVHGVMSYKFLLDRSRKSPFVRSTTSLTTKEFTEYVEKIKNYVSEYGIMIPSSEEYTNLL